MASPHNSCPAQWLDSAREGLRRVFQWPGVGVGGREAEGGVGRVRQAS